MFTSLFDDNFSFICLSSQDKVDYQLSSAEESLVDRISSQKRIKEFYLGRAAANFALKNAGVEDPPPILRNQGGAPIWPVPYLGSISHSGEYSVAVVASSEQVKGVGVDLQQLSRASLPGVLRRACSETERKEVSDNLTRQMSLFSVKESIYKALHPIVNTDLFFTDVEISFSPFSAVLMRKVSEEYQPGYQFDVRYDVLENYVLTAAIID